VVTAIAEIDRNPLNSWQSGTVLVSGGHLAFHRTGGSGPALVLSHGLTDNGLCWSRVAAALAPEFDIVMLDARGHGRSSRICVDAPQDPGQDIAEAIDALGLASPILMGHSVGARAAAMCANANPDRVSKVILEDPPFLPLAERSVAEIRRRNFRQQVEKFQAMSEAQITAMGKASSPGWHEDEFSAWTAAKKQVDPEAMPDYRTSWQASIARITAPTLLIYGERARGGIVTPELAEEAQAINPNISAIQIAGAGHNIRRENFADFLAAVQAFLLH
jgi:N-formylmaleamate deformylase